MTITVRSNGCTTDRVTASILTSPTDYHRNNSVSACQGAICPVDRTVSDPVTQPLERTVTVALLTVWAPGYRARAGECTRACGAMIDLSAMVDREVSMPTTTFTAMVDEAPFPSAPIADPNFFGTRPGIEKKEM